MREEPLEYFSADPRLRAVQGGGNGDRPRCSKCGGIIGVFEPLIALVDGTHHCTSLAARRDVRGTLFHQGCHAEV